MLGIESVAADNPVVIQLPDVALPGDRCAASHRHLVGGVLRLGVGLIQRLNAKVDLRDLEAGDVEVEIEIERRQFDELFGQQLVVPLADLGEPVVGEKEGLRLLWCQVAEDAQ